MFLPHEEAARTRMLARLGVRLIVVLLVFAFLRDVGTAVLIGAAYRWSQPGSLVTMVFDPFWNATWRATPWVMGAATLLLFERPLIRWLAPVPPPGCLRCGYARPEPAGAPPTPCPECGLIEGPNAHAPGAHIQTNNG